MKLGIHAATLALATCLAAPLPGQAQTRYNTQPRGNSVRVDGTSTTHDWEMEGVVIGGFFELGSGVSLDPNSAAISGMQDGKIPARGHAHMSVSTIHSKAEHLPEVMDNLMQKALKADQFPMISFTLTDLAPNGAHAAGKPFDLTAHGNLEIAGVTNKITLPLSISNIDETHIKISGSVGLKMTSYGVTPPAPDIGLGAMRCGDDVKVSFDWTLRKVAAK